MTPSTAQLVDEVRLITDRVNDPTLTDSTIITYLNDGMRSMYDLFLDAAPHWVQTAFEFTLTGDSDATSFVALPDDFQFDLGLDWLNPPGITYPLTIRRLPTFLDRNRLNPYNTLALSPAFYNRNYEVQGANLQLYPKMNCAGTYRLYYQKQIEPLALPVTRAIVIDPSDTVLNVGGFIQYILTNGAFTDADVGGSLTVTWSSPNAAWNASGAEITAKATGNDTTVTTDVVWPGGSFTGPAAGTASITAQPAGTLAELPQVFAPWQLYIKTFAAISVFTSFNENADALQARLAQEAARARRMAEKRESDLRQIPILSGGRGIDSPNFDSGGGWGGWDGGDW